MHHNEFVQDITRLFEKHSIPVPENRPDSATKIEVLLLKAVEALLSTVQDLQSAINSQAAKLSQLEADTNALVTKAGGSGASATPANSIDQATLDSMVQAVTNNNQRIDTLTQNVVGGVQTPTSGTPSSTPPASEPPPASTPTETPPASTPTAAPETPPAETPSTPATAPASAPTITTGAIPPGQTPLSVAAGQTSTPPASGQ